MVDEIALSFGPKTRGRRQRCVTTAIGECRTGRAHRQARHRFDAPALLREVEEEVKRAKSPTAPRLKDGDNAEC
jgi:hypothetical protein